MKAHISPVSKPLRGTIQPPSSKNYTTRYILASCVADGHSVVRRPAVQDDAVALVRCCRQLGAAITARDARGNPVDFEVRNEQLIDYLDVEGFGSHPQAPPPDIAVDPENAGAVLRLLIGVACLMDGEVRFDTARHRESLGTRPNLDLMEALEQIGVAWEATGDNARLPLLVTGGHRRISYHLERRRREEGILRDQPVPVRVSGSVSSQFVSSLLFLVPLLDQHIRVEVTGDLKSKPLIQTTLGVLKDAGIVVKSSGDLMTHEFTAGQKYQAREWNVNGDWPGSAAILAAAAVVPGSEIRVKRLHEDEQGERRCLEFYEAQGCSVRTEEQDDSEVLVITAPAEGSALKAAEIDGDTCTDAVLAMMGAAALAQGTSRFTGVANLQYKECDRVREPVAEMRKLFGSDGNPDWLPADEPDTIEVTGAPEGFEGGIEVSGRGDHRVIMLLSIIGLRCREGLTITGAEHVAKSFPGWFRTLEQMGVTVRLED